ncbi:4-(cytidine 5'-diphospho)-2-C-methyl-D-erythritol kinase [Synechococcus sp. RSCCF101]|uniref:4-(cytidine 5'-diphospho)-2-C-methyl-D-erythritol kinase n=1 Tax=Synechococcus sp. RSCCF101 TaxID=2511069 RepID=UPI001245979B|nr:4-(cytidine 5'-diphospho)-2-C-methyl-D-erythritol kinase [Synechococcus sp. RSCCF101]QEY31581.1 4-(cytidine 5'-diphospho)-2-C-methyl-D-erythritol kinase [Synechococcus sp. RSCCF101]
MAELIVTAPAKVNLHLEVLGLRPDGFHELAMVMQSIDLADTLELQRAADGALELSSDISALSCGPDNLILRAAELLRRHVARPDLGARMHLRKRIPIGAGLAGGSSNGAAALMGLNRLWQLQLTPVELHELAAALGSDVPFCLRGGRQLCFGRGEWLEPVPVPESPLALLLLKHPGVSVSTPWAYGRYRDSNSDRYLSEEAERDGRRRALRTATWLRSAASNEPPPLRNDLQALVAEATPTVRTALELLTRASGNLGAAMSGSGPSCFALFPDPDSALTAQQQLASAIDAAGLQSWCCSLRDRGISLEP